MFALKPISHESVASALAKAEHYRLLAEPSEAESICCDILAVEPGNQHALVVLTLALTDQIPHDPKAFSRAVETAGALESPYERAYYCGIAWERRAKAHHHSGVHGAGQHVYEWLVKALGHFDQAERLRPPGNDDALLRWNTCARFLGSHREVVPGTAEEPVAITSE
jgi:hypothetical protein